ncbi:uncharacterized protein LOC116343405 [Contarinia nasturtii]|uniref:uncharacterized protein LOC116343405 n=1 Tax=Contarinia nasturtii TaxID=265458 RepID=UPI0012D39EB0|nr:uncharacterized protein LOC116343405 [Contarinia nasturtii]
MTDFSKAVKPNVLTKLHGVIFTPMNLSSVDRLRRFFDLSLWQWFIPGLTLIIGSLTAVLGFYAKNIEDNFIRSVIIWLMISITFAASITFIVYKSRDQLDSILGEIVKEKYISNALGGVYFGTQVVRWVISLYFYNENSEHSQFRLALRILPLFLISLYLLLYCTPDVVRLFT